MQIASKIRRYVLLGSTALAIALAVQPGALHATDVDDEIARLEALEAIVKEQQKQLDAQAQALTSQAQVLAEQQRLIDISQQELQQVKTVLIQQFLPGGGGTTPVAASPGDGLLDTLRATGQGDVTQMAQDSEQPVGEAPEERRPDVAAIADQGGILTPVGTIILEPSLQFTADESDQFFFRGIEIVDTVLIGAIDASQIRRESVEAALTARAGLTEWLDVDVKVPFVYRSDDFRGLSIGMADFGNRSIDGSGLGDIELSGHAQLTDGPVYLIANARVKTNTGEGPFDVDRDTDGIETELATGTGFWSFEPSLTFIAPSDPVVFFGNFGYSFNMGQDVDSAIGPDVLVTHVDPGDVLKMTIGMGLALNEHASMGFSYEHNYIFPTESDLVLEGTPESARSDHAHVGLLGISGTYRFNEMISLIGQVQVGATEEAPDLRAMIRLPVSLNVFE